MRAIAQTLIKAH